MARPENYQTLERVLEIYAGVLGSAADAAGANYWVDRIDNGDEAGRMWTYVDVADSFFDQTRVQDMYEDAEGNPLTGDAFLTALYLNIFKRDTPDAAGFAYWQGVMADMGITDYNSEGVGNLVMQMIDGMWANPNSINTTQKLYQNLVAASVEFYNYQVENDLLTPPAEVSDEFLATFRAAATDLLAGITQDSTPEEIAAAVEEAAVIIDPTPFRITASATSVHEDGSITFTVATSKAVTDATDVVFTLVPGDVEAPDQGSTNTNLNDFGGGAFNPVTVTIPAGGTTATFTVNPLNDNLTELPESFSVRAVVVGQTLTQTATLLDGASVPGQTFMLTKGLDNYQGTAGNDTIIGSIDNGNAELNTLSNLDIINGGAGVDTLSIAHGGSGTGNIALGNLSNVEIVTIESANASGLTVDTSAVTGVTNLNVTKAAAVVSATAATTTDISVSMKAANAAVSAFGGKNVSVSLTDISGTGNTNDVNIGSGNAPKGDVVVNLTGAKYTGAAVTFGSGTSGDIDITGGKTVTVTQVASSDTSFAATSSGNSGSGVTQADVKITANADTTTINVKQDVATAKNATATTGGVTETATVKFGALKAGNTLTLDVDGTGAGNNGITLTAKEDMTAADVAQAFANLVANSARLNASGVVTTAGDTQGSIAYTKATYANDTSNSGSGTSLWSSAAASGDTVVFTAATANTDVTNIAFTAASGSGSTTPTAPVVTIVAGKPHDATFTGGVMGAIAGKVEVVGAAALKTVTIDGFGSGSNTSGTTALETLNLSNSAGNAFTVGNAAATLNLNLEKVTDASGSTGSGVTISSGAATLNVKSIGNNVLTAADATTALNVSGNGILTGGASGGLDTIKTITVSETAGLNFSAASSGLTALESVNTTATTGTVTINIGSGATYTGGAGVDNVTVTNASGTGIAKAIDLGAGDDTLILNGTGSTTPTVDIKGGEGVDTLSMTAGTAAALGAAFAAKVSGFERLTLNDQVATSGDVTVNLKTLGFTNYVTTTGYNDAATTGKLILNNLADNATVVLAGNQTGSGSGAIEAKIEGAADSTTNVLNVIGTTATGNLTAGKLVANEVETINLTATDTAPLNASGQADIQTISLTLAADKATAVNLGTSNANLTLMLDSTTNKLATVDGNAMTGNLTVDLTAHNGVAMTVKGGAGADVLKASAGANAKADVLIGGAGNDVLYAGTNGAKLTGGEGNDLFVVMDSAASGSPFNGNKQVNTYSTIEDFQAGDVLQLLWNAGSGSNATGADAVVNSFAKLTATLDAGTSVFTDYVSAAMEQMAATTTGTGGDAVWFKIGNDSYVVIDNGVETTGAFVNGEDLIVKLTGLDLTSASFNTTYGTVTL